MVFNHICVYEKYDDLYGHTPSAANANSSFIIGA